MLTIMGTTPRPLRSKRHQSCFDGILLDVSNDPPKVIFIPDKAIEVIFLPRGSRASAIEHFDSFPTGKPLPSLHDFAQRNLPNLNQNVNMIWHHHPSEQTIPNPVIVP